MCTSRPTTPIRPVRRALAVSVTALIALLAAAPAPAADKASIPKNNLIDNPSFKKSVSGWSGMESSVKRIRVARAPHGREAAKVKATPGASSYTLDDAPSTVARASAGAAYTGSAWVKGSSASVGKPISLVVREWDAGGEYVDSTVVTRTLTRGFTSIRAEYVAEQSGGEVDVYLERSEDVVAGERFVADAITLAPGGSGGGGGDESPAHPPAGDESPVHPPAGDGPPPLGTNLEGGITTSQIAIGYDNEPQLFSETGTRYRYLVIRDNMHDQLAELRAVHPESDLVLYKNVAFTQVEPEPGCPWYPFQGGGLSYCAADPHESWFLHSRTTGERLASEGYSALRAMNIANPQYREAWVDAVLARLQDARNDGSGERYDAVWLDDTNTFPGHGIDGNIAELTDAQYRHAMVDFIDYAAARIEAAGFTTVANLAANPWEPAERAAGLEVARDVDVVNREGFVRWGEQTTFAEDGAGPHWIYEVEFAEDILAAGADLHAITYGQLGDSSVQRYGRATFLLVWDGHDGSAYNFRTESPGPTTWTTDWTTDIGVPTSARYRVGNGWRRNFAGGTVIVNAKSSGSQTFNLGGSFKRPDGSCTSSVTLSATEAMVMPACS